MCSFNNTKGCAGAMAASFFLLVCISASFLVSCSGGTLVINVTEGGHNLPDCLRGVSSCRTLGYALSVLENVTADVQIHVWYSHVVNDSSRHLRGVQNVLIEGHGMPAINCSGPGNGVWFNVSTNLSIVGLAWNNCSVRHPTSAILLSHKQYTNHQAFSALFFSNCTDVSITNCSFTSSFGSGVSMYNVIGDVTVTWSNFSDHHVMDALRCPNSSHPAEPGVNTSDCSPQAVGLYIEATHCTYFVSSIKGCNATEINEATYTISHSSFQRNRNPEAYNAFPTRLNPANQWPFGRGGGLAIIMRAFQVAYSNFTIEHCNFSNNSALWASGIFVKFLSDYPFGNKVIIRNSTFISNNASFSGGGMRIGMILTNNGHHFPNNSENVLQLESLNFISNRAAWGAGLSLYSNPTVILRFNLNITNCHWLNNTASNSSSAVGITRWAAQVITSPSIVTPIFTNCTFYKNTLTLPVKAPQLHGFGGVYTEGIPLVFQGNTVFDSNSASTLMISSAAVTFKGSVEFRNGHSLRGGGIHLAGSSWIVLTDNVNILFINNTALQLGGAIFYTFPPSLALPDSDNCFLQYSFPGNDPTPLNNWTVNLTFVDNSAVEGGHAIFLTDPTECVWPTKLGGSPFNTSRTKLFVYKQKQESRVVATSAQHMTFDPSSVKVIDGLPTYSISPGDNFDLTIHTTDYYNQQVAAVYSLTCSSLEDYKHANDTNYCKAGGNSQYQLHGGSVFTSNTVMSSLILSGPQSGESPHDDNFVLKFTTFDDYVMVGVLRINFLPCRLGMQYMPDKRMCECVATSHISCQKNAEGRMTPILAKNYWYGRINTSSSSEFVIQACRGDRCAYPWCSGDFDLGCQIPEREEKYCTHGRVGPLCSSCPANLSLTYDAYGCSTCSVGKKIGLIILIVAYWMAVVLEIILLIKFNVAMSSAGFYAILYFYSIVGYVLRVQFPFSLGPLFYFFVAFSQLDPYFLVYTEFCLFDSVTSIQYQAIHFIHPIMISLILYILYCIERCGRFRISVLSGENAIPAVCILILISYTSLAATAMHLLDPLTFIKANTDKIDYNYWFVSVQPDTPYMDATKHLPFALMAIFVLFGLVLPFTIFMILAPWLAKKVNLIKIKPFLDNYQNCFHDDHRYFAGVYLVARQLFFLTSISAINLQLNLYLQQLISLGLLTLHTFVQPYQKKWLNRVDMLILLDICLLTFNIGATAESGFEKSNVVRKIFIVILSFAPMMFIGAVIVHRLWKKYWQKCQACVQSKREMMSFTSTTINVSETTEDDLPELRDDSPKTMRSFNPERTPLVGERMRSVNRTPSSRVETGRGGPQAVPPPRAVSEPNDVATGQVPHQREAATKSDRGLKANVTD